VISAFATPANIAEPAPNRWRINAPKMLLGLKLIAKIGGKKNDVVTE
jgi:hypothetical protein